jgi:hypothetical protein
MCTTMKTRTPDFKAKIALQAIRGYRTAAKLLTK